MTVEGYCMIPVKVSTKEKIKTLKDKHHLKSYDEAIRKAIEEWVKI